MAYKTRRGGGFSKRPTWGKPQNGFQKREEPSIDLNKHPLGSLLETTKLSDLESTTESDGGDVSIQDCTYIALYNWLNQESPTILVPGKSYPFTGLLFRRMISFQLILLPAYSYHDLAPFPNPYCQVKPTNKYKGKPPQWTPYTTTQDIPEDRGSYYRDPNAARYPPFPTLPAVLSILHTTPFFPTHEIDVFACGSTLGNLLRFTRSVNKPFRFKVQLIGSTVFLIRMENDPRELIEGIHGYGHTFPEAYTTWDESVKGSESHQRLIRYRFAGMNCVVRFECDGYVPQLSSDATSKTSRSFGTKYDIDTLVNELTATSTSRKGGRFPLSGNTEITIKSDTDEDRIPQDLTFDLKTRSNRSGREIDLEDFYPVLWLKQIPRLIVAYHNGRGRFAPETIQVMMLHDEVRRWETENERGIRRYSTLLKRILKVAKQAGDALLEVCSAGDGTLEIRKQHGEGQHALPLDVRDKWKGLPMMTDSKKDNPDIGISLVGGNGSDEADYTACSADDCGYCGKCSY